MAQRQFSELQFSLLKRLVSIYCRVNIGGSGAVTLQKWSYPIGLGSGSAGSYGAAPTTGVGYAVGNGEGVRSVVRNGTGDWTITLSDSYQRLVGVDATFTASSGLAGAINVGVNSTTTSVTTFTAVGNGGLIRLTFISSQNTAADPNSGDKVDLAFTLADSTTL